MISDFDRLKNMEKGENAGDQNLPLSPQCFEANVATEFVLIHHFEIVPNSKKLLTTTGMWLLEDFKIQIA